MILSGVARLGRDAELRTIQSGTAVCNLALAFTIGYGENKGTTWIESSLWGTQAEKLAPYLLKGKLFEVALEDVKLDSYDQNGQTKSKLVARVVKIGFVPGQQSEGESPKPAPAPKPAASFEDFDNDDDLPF